MRKFLRFLFRLSFRSLVILVLFIGVYFLTAWLCTFIASNNERTNADGTIDIYILSNGVHTDIVMPVLSFEHNWNESFPPGDFEGTHEMDRYVGVGWGDKGFFLETPTWADLKFSTAFKAAFWLGSSALHVTYHERAPAIGERCRKIKLGRKEYLQLCSGIIADLEPKNGQRQLIDHPGYGNGDKFYEAKGTYNLFYTCNVWTGDKLATAGAKVSPWTPFDWGVFAQL